MKKDSHPKNVTVGYLHLKIRLLNSTQAEFNSNNIFLFVYLFGCLCDDRKSQILLEFSKKFVNKVYNQYLRTTEQNKSIPQRILASRSGQQ